VVESAQVNPQRTTIRGPASELAKVSTVRVEIPIPSAPEQFDSMIHPTPTGAHGDEVSNVQVSPNLVRVRARFISTTGKGGNTK
jgi:hypothetical protein